MRNKFIVYRQEAITNRIEDVTFHRSYDAAAKEIKRRALKYRLEGSAKQNDWIGIREIVTIKEV